MTSKYLFLAGSQCTIEEKEKMKNYSQALCIPVQSDPNSFHLEQHEINSHILIDGKIFICMDSISGKSNCQFCILNTFNEMNSSIIDNQQNLIVNFRQQQDSSIDKIQNWSNRLDNSNPEVSVIQELVHQIMNKKLAKQWSDETSNSCFSSSNTLSFSSYDEPLKLNCPFMSISFGNNDNRDSPLQVQLSQQFLQMLDWSAEDLQLEINSRGMLEFSTGYNLNQPLIWLLSQMASNHTSNVNFSSSSPYMAQQYFTKQKQMINAIVQYEIMATPQRFNLIIKIVQVESNQKRRYPQRNSKAAQRTNYQQEQTLNFDQYFKQQQQQSSFGIHQNDLISQKKNVLSTEEIQFIHKYFDQNLALNHPELINRNLKTCNYRLLQQI